MISLISREDQYIIAESTRTLSSQSDDVYQSGDKLIMGVRVIKRTKGICGHALASGFNLDCQSQDNQRGQDAEQKGEESPYNPVAPQATIFPDLAKVQDSKIAPFFHNEPRTRFYVGVPIKTKRGHVIGSYCVMDDMPRSGASHDQLQFLRDMATTVMEHLEFMALRNDHNRSEKMLKALGLFVEHRSSISEWWLRTNGNDEGPVDYISDSVDQSELEVDSNVPTRNATKSAPDQESPKSNDSGSSVVPTCLSQNPKRPDGSDQLKRDISGKDSEDTLHKKIQQLALDSDQTSEELVRNPDANHHVKETEHNVTDKHEKALHEGPPEKDTATSSPIRTKTNTSNDIRAMFSRASNLIRESTGVDGAMFFDASAKSFNAKTYDRSRRRMDKHADTEPSSSEDSSSRYRSSDTNETGSSSTERPRNAKSQKGPKESRYCEVLGFSTQSTSSLNGQEAESYQLTVAQEFVSKILGRYPNGKIFAFDEDESISSSEEDCLHSAQGGISLAKKDSSGRKTISRRDEASSILQIFPGSRFIMVLPIWDSRHEKWCATSMLWTTDPTRVLTSEDDMSYLASFSNNIIAEIYRLEAVAADQAKNTFISSISHELRSPLHGIMGSLELLRDTTLTRFQNETMDTIKECSTTLLDTLNHVLDYAKINNFITGKQKERKQLKASKGHGGSRKARPAESAATYGAISLASNLFLDTLTEEVVQTIYLGHYQAQLLGTTDSVDGSESAFRSSTLRQSVFVILDLDWSSRWCFHVQSGAWRRILMNLFGNALKYTTEGFVQVRLECRETDKHKLRSNSSTCTLTVSDSGKGVSSNFINERIFVPFAQEDSLSPGTGLGLSIVRQIVDSLGGQIDFQSVLGQGTTVKVILPVQRTTNAESTSTSTAAIDNELVIRARGYIQRKKAALIISDPENSQNEDSDKTGRKRAPVLLRTALARMVQQCFDMEIILDTELDDVQADIYIATEAAFERRFKGCDRKALPGSASGPPLIIITSSAVPEQKSLPLSHLSQP